MAKLMSKGKIADEWATYLAFADTYIDKFDSDGTETYTCESEHFKNPKTLKFSSQKNEKVFGDDSSAVETETGTGIVMGLNNDDSTIGEISLTTALTMFGVEPKNASLKKALEILQGLGLIEIDVNRPGNGFWIIPKVVEPEEPEEEEAGGDGGEETEEGKKKIETTGNSTAPDTKVVTRGEKPKNEETPKTGDIKTEEEPENKEESDKEDAKPEESLQIATRLAYKSKGIGSKDAQAFFKDLTVEFPDFKLLDTKTISNDEFAIILTDIITFKTETGKVPVISSTITISFLKLRDLIFYISQTDGQTTIAIRQESRTPKGDPIPPPDPAIEDPDVAIKQVDDLKTAIEAPGPSEIVPGDNFKSIRLWYAELTPKTKGWIIALIMVLPISKNVHGQVPIYLKYDKTKKTFSGGMLRGDMPEETNLMLPTYREYHALPDDILTSNEAAPWIDLADAYGFKAPKGLPTKLTKANITYTQKQVSPIVESRVWFEVHLESGQVEKEDLSTPPAPFNWDNTKFEFEKKGKAEPSWTLTSEFSLIEQQVADGVDPRVGKLGLEISKGETGLHVKGEAGGINFAMLGSFFDPDFSEAMVSILGKIEIEKLLLDYNYNSTGKASDFLFSGTINIGKLQLDLFYQYASSVPGATSEEARKGLLKSREGKGAPAKPAVSAKGDLPEQAAVQKKAGPPAPPPVKVEKDTAWQFDAYLSAAGPGETLGTIIESIIGENPLPSFIGNIDVPTVGIDVEEAGKPLISLKVAKMDDSKVIFIFNVNIPDVVEVSFIQIGNKKKPEGSVPIGNKKQPKGPVEKPIRILRLSIGPLPFIKDIPIVNELPQPYQLLTFCYVGGGPVDSPGITKADIDNINKLYIPDSKIFYKAISKEKDSIGLRYGNHFIIVNNDECILDHVFGTGQPTKKTKAITDGKPSTSGAPVADDPPAKDNTAVEQTNPPAKGALQKKSKFLTITGISVQYKNTTLWLFINATLAMGPVELSLIGFGIGLKLGADGLRLNDIVNTFNMEDLDFQINGVAMNFDQPPVLIAGVFIHEVTKTLNSYRGGIAIGFKPYEFVAVGEYAEVTENNQKYKSIFLYAKLDGPLIDLQIAIIKGVRLGFGYNSFVRSPEVHELADFPFINDSGIGGAGNNPMKILEGMRGGPNPWVAPRQDSFWFAVGFSVSAFNLLTATAVAILGFSDEGVVASIYADVVCMMPPEVPSPDMCIVYVELLMNAELNFIHDYFFVQAALAPTSFLLVPQCHLYGGFAMGTWFGRSPYAGDWVFTVGGYHRQFVRPDHYPNPERLGIRFNIGDNISISGEGYFAITPKAVMGGSMTRIQLSVGPVSAHLTTAWDAILQFNPLHYAIDMYVEVGVSCRVHLLFVSFDISIEIGADLHIEGPEFGGIAHVDFWFFGFDIYFGEQPGPPPPLTLAEFYDVVAKAGPPEAPTKGKKDTIEQDSIVQLKLSLEEGAAPAPVEDAEKDAGPPNAGSGSKWRVRGGDFKFRVSSVFAISSATLETKESVAIEKSDPAKEKSLEQIVKAEKVVDISSIPMQVHAKVIQSPMKIKIINEGANAGDLKEIYPSGWQPEFVVKLVPTALWGDPNNPPDALNAKDGCVPLQMAVSITAPLPTLAVSKIPPVDATDIARQFVFENWLAETETQVGMTAAPLEKPSKSLKAWDVMQKAWEASVSENVETAKSLVDGCMKTLGWNFPAPEVAQKAEKLVPKPWELEAKLPTRLVSGNKVKVEGVEDGLANFYLALPRMCV